MPSQCQDGQYSPQLPLRRPRHHAHTKRTVGNFTSDGNSDWTPKAGRKKNSRAKGRRRKNSRRRNVLGGSHFFGSSSAGRGRGGRGGGGKGVTSFTSSRLESQIDGGGGGGNVLGGRLRGVTTNAPLNSTYSRVFCHRFFFTRFRNTISTGGVY